MTKNANKAVKAANRTNIARSLRWRVSRLAMVSPSSIRTPRRPFKFLAFAVERNVHVRRALGAAGVEFVDENVGGPGVRLRERLPAISLRRAGMANLRDSK